MSEKKSVVIGGIARYLSEEYGGSIVDRTAQVRLVFKALKALMSDPSMKPGDRVMIDGFGIFTYKTRAGRTFESALTPDKVTVEPKNTYTFKPVKAFDEALNA